MEYYCITSLGLVAIIPHPRLPTAVELFVAGQKCGDFLSAEVAARAVASSSTHHWRLDSLACWNVPLLLSEWKQSLPLACATGTVATESPDPRVFDEDFNEHLELAPDLVFDCDD